MKRLDDFDSVFVNIVLSMMLSIVVMANFAPWTLLFVYEDTTGAPNDSRAAVASPTVPAKGQSMMTASIVSADRPLRSAVTADVLIPEMDTLVFVALILFIIKYIHENSVLKHCLRDSDIPIGSGGQFLVFLSRLVFLAGLFSTILQTYLWQGGQFLASGNDGYFFFTALSAYLVPDLVLCHALMPWQRFMRPTRRNLFGFLRCATFLAPARWSNLFRFVLRRPRTPNVSAANSRQLSDVLTQWLWISFVTGLVWLSVIAQQWTPAWLSIQWMWAFPSVMLLALWNVSGEAS